MKSCPAPTNQTLFLRRSVKCLRRTAAGTCSIVNDRRLTSRRFGFFGVLLGRLAGVRHLVQVHPEVTASVCDWRSPH